MSIVEVSPSENLSTQLSDEILQIIQRDTARKILNYLQYKPSMIEKMLSTLGFAKKEISEDIIVPVDPRNEDIEIKSSTKKKSKSSKEGKKNAQKKSNPSNVQVAYRSFMALNTNIENKEGIKFKLMQKFPNKSKKEIHTMALKEISSIWKNMSAEEKNITVSMDNNAQLKQDKASTPVEISSADEDSEDDTECEEMTFGKDTYAVEMGDEPRSVYTMEGVEVGTYTQENGLQLF